MKKKYIVQLIMSIFVIIICAGVMYREYDTSWLSIVQGYALYIACECIGRLDHKKRSNDKAKDKYNNETP